MCTRCNLPKDAVTLLDMCDAFSDLVNLAGYISSQNVGILLQEDAFENQYLRIAAGESWNVP